MTKKDLAKVLREKLGLHDWKPFTMGGNIWFERKNDKGQLEWLIFGLFTARGGYYFAASVTGEKAFPEVESILNKYYKKFGIKTRQMTVHFHSIRDESLFLDIIHSPNELDRLLPRLSKMVHEEVLSFFNNYQTIEQVNEKMKTLAIPEVSQFIFLPQTLRVLVIKRLVNAPDFLEYGDWLTSLAHTMQDPEKYTVLIPELFEELKNR